MKAKAKNKKSIEVGGLAVFDEPEVGSVVEKRVRWHQRISKMRLFWKEFGV